MSLFLPGRLGITTYIIYLYFFCVVCFSFFSNIRFKFDYVIVFFIPLIFFPISLITESIFWGFTETIDLKIMFFYIAYLTGFNIIVSASIIDKKKLFEKAIITFTFAGIILSLIAIQQWLDLFNLNSIYLPYLNPIENVQLENLLRSNNPRPIGFIGNPNEFGFQLGICLISAWYGLLNFDKKKTFLTSFMLCFFSVIITSSRSSFVFAVAGMFFVFWGSNIRFRVKFFIFSAGLIVITILTMVGLNIPFLEPKITRIFEIINLSQSRSWNLRAELYWWFNIEWFIKSPIFGVGPISSISLKAADNEWYFLLRRWGIIGTTTLLIPIIYPFLKNLKEKAIPKDKLSLTLGLLVGGALYMLPAAFISSYILYTPWAILYFIVFKY
jgi:hypothetical protein